MRDEDENEDDDDDEFFEYGHGYDIISHRGKYSSMEIRDYLSTTEKWDDDIPAIRIELAIQFSDLLRASADGRGNGRLGLPGEIRDTGTGVFLPHEFDEKMRASQHRLETMRRSRKRARKVVETPRRASKRACRENRDSGKHRARHL